MKFILIRHGKAECNTLNDDDIMSIYDKDSPLTEEGILQANKLAKNFPQKLFPTKVYSSPLKRSVDTANIFAKQHNLPIYIDERLAELNTNVCFFPPITIKEWDSILEQRIFNSKKEIKVGVETLHSHYSRVASFIEDIFLENQINDDIIIIFTHALTIEMFLIYLLDLDMKHLQKVRYKISNTGIFIIENNFKNGRARLVTANNRFHLGII